MIVFLLPLPASLLLAVCDNPILELDPDPLPGILSQQHDGV